MRRVKTPMDQAGEDSKLEPSVEAEEQDSARDGMDAAGRGAAEIAALTEKVLALTDENAQLKDQVMRTMADLQNFRRRAAQEKIELQRYAAEQLVVELLPILDSFERALGFAESGAGVESLVEGLRATDRQLRGILESKNLERIAAEGSQFDPDLHHALAMHETDEVEEGTVTHEIEAGYRLSGKVIRPAKVRVAKKP